MNPSRIEMLENFIREDPSDPFNYYALAMEFQSSDVIRSGELFEHVLQHFPEYLPVYYTAGVFFAEQGNEPRGLEILNQGITLAQTKKDLKALRELNNAKNNLEN